MVVEDTDQLLAERARPFDGEFGDDLVDRGYDRTAKADRPGEAGIARWNGIGRTPYRNYA